MRFSTILSFALSTTCVLGTFAPLATTPDTEILLRLGLDADFYTEEVIAQLRPVNLSDLSSWPMQQQQQQLSTSSLNTTIDKRDWATFYTCWVPCVTSTFTSIGAVMHFSGCISLCNFVNNYRAKRIAEKAAAQRAERVAEEKRLLDERLDQMDRRLKETEQASSGSSQSENEHHPSGAYDASQRYQASHYRPSTGHSSGDRKSAINNMKKYQQKANTNAQRKSSSQKKTNYRPQGWQKKKSYH